jgi:NAD(P)-dependent dehydrogenase (short-subunit alcohol dehydrogenase family)
MSNKEFAGKRAVITGGSREIGAAIAQRLIDGGATVVVTSRSLHEQTPTDATFISSDIRTEAGIKALAADALKALGGIDYLVNNAGIPWR